MPEAAEFAERQYELAVNLELLGGAGSAFSVPTQNAEADLGYDVALVPALAAIWSILGHGRPLPGAPPGRGILAHPAAPVFAASLFIQYKTPEWLHGNRAKEAPRRAELGASTARPYFRYPLRTAQLEKLAALSRQVRGEAEVCYAAPAFITTKTLHALQLHGSVVSESDFLSLQKVERDLAGSGSHTHVWTYRGPGHDGALCSEPRRVESWGGDELRAVLGERCFERARTVEDHVFSLRGSIEELEDGLEERDQPVASAAAEIERFAERSGLSWSLVLTRPLSQAS